MLGVIVVAAFEPPAVVAGLDDVAVMGQPVEQRGGHLGVAEHAGPFAEGEIDGDDDGSTLVEPAIHLVERPPSLDRAVEQIVDGHANEPDANLLRRC